MTDTAKWMEISALSAEIDKVDCYWTIAYFPTSELVLRLRIRHYSNDWPDEYTCDIKLSRADEFVTLATFTFVTDFLIDEYATHDVSAFPAVCNGAFIAMARYWANLKDEISFAWSTEQWNDGDPIFEGNPGFSSQIGTEITSDDAPPDRIH